MGERKRTQTRWGIRHRAKFGGHRSYLLVVIVFTYIMQAQHITITISTILRLECLDFLFGEKFVLGLSQNTISEMVYEYNISQVIKS